MAMSQSFPTVFLLVFLRLKIVEKHSSFDKYFQYRFQNKVGAPPRSETLCSVFVMLCARMTWSSSCGSQTQNFHQRLVCQVPNKYSVSSKPGSNSSFTVHCRGLMQRLPTWNDKGQFFSAHGTWSTVRSPV